MSYYTISLPELQLACDEIIEVTNSSPQKIRQSVLKLATYFRREFQYDFVQFSLNDKEKYVAYIFTNNGDYTKRRETVLVFGACCFRYRDCLNEPHGWAMQWIWLHPYFRGKGHLSKAW